MTKNKRAILEALKPVHYLTAKKRIDDDPDQLLIGQAPYSAIDIANRLSMNRSNVHRTLKAMVDEGLVVKEMRKRSQVSGLPRLDEVEKNVPHYWNAATMAVDKVYINTLEHDEIKQYEEMSLKHGMDLLFSRFSDAPPTVDPEEFAALEGALTPRLDKLYMFMVFQHTEIQAK